MKKLLKILGLLIVFLLIIVLGFFWRDAVTDKYKTEINNDLIPTFSPISLGFNHTYDSKTSLPLAPSSLIDIDNDGVDEVFFGGGLGQADEIFAYHKDGFVNITAKTKLHAKSDDLTSASAASADFDNNGFVDLIVGRENGLTIYYNNNGVFTEKKIHTPVNQKSNPAGITFGDIDKDGDLDIFLSTYLKKELMEGQTIFEDYTYGSTSELLLNDGQQNFKSITKSAGLDYIHNTFQGALVDIDNDTWLDLIVVHDTGEARTYRNNGDLTFTMKENPLTKKFAYPMGLAIGDYNNDGLVDFMFSNTGSTLPRALAKGDIKDATKFNEKWILFKNEGNFKFTDVAEEAKIADYEFSWGCTFADLNNDGLQDLMVAENYVDLAPNKLFRLPSRVLIQKEDHTFVPTETQSGLKNPHFGITSLVSDFNQDGYLDMIWTNIDSPSLAYINNGGNRNYLKVDIGDANYAQGARVIVKTAKQAYTNYIVSGEGLVSDQTAIVHFGIDDAKTIDNVTVVFSDGKEVIVNNPTINTTLKIAYPTVATAIITDEL